MIYLKTGEILLGCNNLNGHSSSLYWNVGNQFLLVFYDKEFDLNFSVTAGALGGHNIIEENSVTISFTNYWCSHGDLWGQIVYMNPDVNEHSQGFYIWAVNHEENLVSLVPFRGILGTFQIIGTLQLALLEPTRVNYYKSQEHFAAKETYKDFHKDKHCLGHHACSYTVYMSHIIDELLSEIELLENTGESELHQLEVGYCDHQLVSPISDWGSCT